MDNVNTTYDRVFRVTEWAFGVADRTVRTVYRDQQSDSPTVLDWITSEGRWARYLYTACVLFSAFNTFALITFKTDVMEPEFKAWIYLFHALVILMAFIFIFKDKLPTRLEVGNSSVDFGGNKDKIGKSLQRASVAIAHFLQYWKFVWVFWFFLYVFLSMNCFLLIRYTSVDLWFFGTVLNMMNNATALIFFSMYYELSERTVDSERPKELWMILLLFLALAGAMEFVLSALNNGPDNTKVLGRINFVFNVLSGVITGTATVLLITRLASRIIGVPPVAIVMLVLYCVVQPLFPMVSNPKGLTETVIGDIAVNLSLYGKITLLVVIHWSRFTHRLTYYMVRALQMLEEEGVTRRIFVNEFLPIGEKFVKSPNDSSHDKK